MTGRVEIDSKDIYEHGMTGPAMHNPGGINITNIAGVYVDRGKWGTSRILGTKDGSSTASRKIPTTR